METIDSSKTSYRVNFACQRILSGRQTTRSFDNCFENDDAHIVGGKVYARALKNPKLMDALPRYLDADMCKADHLKLKG